MSCDVRAKQSIEGQMLKSLTTDRPFQICWDFHIHIFLQAEHNKHKIEARQRLERKLLKIKGQGRPWRTLSNSLKHFTFVDSDVLNTRSMELKLDEVKNV